MSDQAKLVVDTMAAQGENNLIVVDKKRAEMLIVDHGDVIARSPMLYGKGRGEDEKADMNVTPAGAFSMREYAVDPKEYQGGRGLSFLTKGNFTWMIHPTWRGKPGEKRDERLASPDPADNAVSNGCINVPYDFYRRLDLYVKTHSVIRDNGGARARYMPTLVILPANDAPDVTRAVFAIPKTRTDDEKPHNPTP